MCSHTDGPDARAAATVRDAEGLVQIQVGDVSSELAGLGEAHQGVEVGAVDVYLSPGVMNHGADVGHGCLENTVR